MSFINNFPKNSEKVQLISDLRIKKEFSVEVAFGMKKNRICQAVGERKTFEHRKDISKDLAFRKYGTHFGEEQVVMFSGN